MQDFDSQPAIMFLNGADDFVKSSEFLHARINELELCHCMPPIYLCGHGFELLLKAFLRAKGLSVDELRSLGHGLLKLYDRAVDNSLQHTLDTTNRQLLELLDSVIIHTRYTHIGGLATPKLEPAYALFRELRAHIGPVVQLDFDRLVSGAGDGRR